jgi:CBS domain-containing protein
MGIGSSSLIQQTVEHLRHYAPFDRMELDHLSWLASRLKVGYYDQGEVILTPEQGVARRLFIIRQGMVEGRQGAGRSDESLTHQLQEGEFFPLSALLARRPTHSTFRAGEDAFCYELELDDFDQLLRLSDIFNDYCTRRIANLLEQSANTVQAQYSQSSTDLQSMSSPLSDVIRREPVTCTPDTPVRQVLQIMHELGIGSMVAVDNGLPVGIFTVNDVLNRVALPQIDIDQPIFGLMSKRLFTLPPHALAYEAALAMAKQGVRHVMVTNDGKLVGVVSERDLFALQRVGLRQISTTIRSAKDLETLKQSARDIQQLAQNMLAQGVAAEQLTLFISTLNELLTVRVIELKLARAKAEPEWVDLDFCWMAMGSEGRFEQTLTTDQDNGIIFRTPANSTPDEVRARLLPLATAINLALDECGFPLCKGGIMASNPRWCLSREEWENTFAQWISRGNGEELLNASIFFDFRPLYGNAELAQQLRYWLNGKVKNNRMFLRKMVENALGNRPPLSLLRNFLVDRKGEAQNTLNLKINGVTPFVDVARIFALASGSNETGTAQRLRAACDAWRMDRAETDAWIESFLYIQLLRLRLQHQQTGKHEIMSNRINPDTLNALDQHILKETFRQARILQGVLEKFFTF